MRRVGGRQQTSQTCPQFFGSQLRAVKVLELDDSCQKALLDHRSKLAPVPVVDSHRAAPNVWRLQVPFGIACSLKNLDVVVDDDNRFAHGLPRNLTLGRGQQLGYGGQWIGHSRLSLRVPRLEPKNTSRPMAARILVVDDEDAARTYVSQVLTLAGYEVTAARDGDEALRLIEQQPPFDLFAIDVMMPAMNGTELARQVRRANPDAKILYITGFSERLFADKELLWEDEAFVEKPTTPEGLVEAVSLLLYGSVTRPPAAA